MSQFIKLDIELLKARNLSLTAKILYALIADREESSKKNDKFQDAYGTFVIYTVDEVCEMLNISKPTAIAAFKELESTKLILRKRSGQGRADKIYVSEVKNLEVKKLNFKKSKNFTSRDKKNLLQEVKKIDPNQNNQSETINQNSQSSSSTLEKIKKQVNFDKITAKKKNSKNLLILICEIIAENYEKFADLEQKHIDFLIDNIEKARKHSKIVNLRAYTLACIERLKTDYDAAAETGREWKNNPDLELYKKIDFLADVQEQDEGSGTTGAAEQDDD